MEKICAVNVKEKEHDTAYHFTWNNQYNRLFNKKIPVVVLIVMGIVGIASSFYAQQSIISVAVALIPGIVLMAAAFLTGEQIGYGDAAVVTLMGLFVTADIVCSTMVMGFTIAGIISVILIASGRAGRKKQIAFTPFLLLGYGLTEVFM